MKKLLIAVSVFTMTCAKAQNAVLTRTGIEVTVYSQAVQDSIASARAALKVDKVNGMGLSEANYTAAEKEMLAGFVSFDPTTLNPLFGQKVDKVAGMGLSQNSYTNDDLTHLRGLTQSNLTLNQVLTNGAATDLDIHLGNINQFGQTYHHGPNGDADTIFRLMAGPSRGALIGTSDGTAMFFNGSFGVGRIATGNFEPSLSVVGNIYMDHFMGNGSNLVRYMNDGSLSNAIGDISVSNLTINGLLRNMAMADGINGSLMIDGSGSVYKRPVVISTNPLTKDDNFPISTAGQTSFALTNSSSGDVTFYLNGVKINKQFVTKSRGGNIVTYSGTAVNSNDNVSIVYIYIPSS